MSNQNPKDQISKASWTLMEGIKDAVAANVASSVQSKQLDIKPEVVQKLLLILNVSVEEGYHRASRVFARSVDAAVAQLTPQVQATEKSKKK